MEKQNCLKKMLLPMLLCCAWWNVACVNQVAEDEVEEGSVPILFSVKRGISPVVTKVTDTAFEKGDKIGLFAKFSSSTIYNDPYIDNLCLEVAKDLKIVPEEAVFYPEGGMTLDFISYYPYRSEGKQEGKATIPVSVEADQSVLSKRSQSDFLIARKSAVKSSPNAVELEYVHKFAKVKVVLVPGEGEKAEDIRKDNPLVVATGFKTKADYDLEQDAFSKLTNSDDIVLSGTWVVTNGVVTGKEAIIIPQEVDENACSFSIEWNGRMYSYSFPYMQLKGGTEREIRITLRESTTDVLQGVVGDVTNWEEAPESSVDSEKEAASIHLAALSFNASNVYRVYYEGKPLVEINKEFLNSGGISSQAIVAYPMFDTEKADLSQGLILKSFGEDDAICGGKISWNEDSNSFTYQAGDGVPVSSFYVTADKEILLERTDDAVNVNVVGYTLKDFRGGILEEYPIVKIGTQYWMRASLRATAYRNGEELTKQTALGQEASYFKPNGYDLYFYNGETLLAGTLSPVGWKIPFMSDWKRLEEYAGGDAALFKVGDWQVLKEGEVLPNNNLTMFDVYPIGIWINDMHSCLYQMSAFWSWDEANQTVSESAPSFIGESSEFVWSLSMGTGKDYYKGFSIRCVKE